MGAAEKMRVRGMNTAGHTSGSNDRPVGFPTRSAVGGRQPTASARAKDRLSGDHLRVVLREHIAYYNHERNHQGLVDHKIPIPSHDRDLNLSHPVKCRSRLGKTLNFYYRTAV